MTASGPGSGAAADAPADAPGPGPFEVDGRPAPAPRAPPRQALREVYALLLVIEQERLAVAVRIERERSIVFPETSVIVRDVRTLAERLYGPDASGEAAGLSEAHGPGENGGAGPPTSGLSSATRAALAGVAAGGEDDDLAALDVDSLLTELALEAGDGGEP